MRCHLFQEDFMWAVVRDQLFRGELSRKKCLGAKRWAEIALGEVLWGTIVQGKLFRANCSGGKSPERGGGGNSPQGNFIESNYPVSCFSRENYSGVNVQEGKSPEVTVLGGISWEAIVQRRNVRIPFQTIRKCNLRFFKKLQLSTEIISMT